MSRSKQNKFSDEFPLVTLKAPIIEAQINVQYVLNTDGDVELVRQHLQSTLEDLRDNCELPPSRKAVIKYKLLPNAEETKYDGVEYKD